MRLKLKLSTKITAIIIMMVTACAASVGLFVYKEVEMDLYKMKGTSALSMASSIAASLDPKEIAILDATNDISSPYYAYLKRTLGNFAVHTSSKYLFVLTKVDDEHFKFIYAQSGREAQVDSESVYRELGTISSVTNFNETALYSYQAGSAMHSAPFYNDTFGDLIVGYAPILHEDGSVVAVVGVYGSLDDVHLYLGHIRQITLTTIIVSIIVFGLISYTYADHSIKAPIEALTLMSSGVVNGDLSFDVYVKSNDEIGFLYNNFKKMQATIKGITDAIHELSDAQIAGDTDATIDTEQFSGAYKDVAISINDLIVDLHSDVMEILNAFINVSSGNFAMTLAQRPGKKILANEAFEIVKESLYSVYCGLNTLVQNMAESELASGGAVSQYSGDWGPLMNKVAKLHLEAEEQRQIILDGMHYASILQRSLLPQSKHFAKTFADHAVIWKPRDVVGGDIYWLRRFDDGTLLCVADCTGHGTSGALLTMLLKSALDTVVTECNYKDTAEIIWGVEQKFVSVFNVKPRSRVKGKAAQVQNGCDLAVMFIANDGEVTISSGFINVFVCDGEKVTRIKGQRIFVGDGQLSGKDDVQVVRLTPNPGDKFYISSDGLFDQVGGNPPRPYGYREFTSVILEHHDKTSNDILQKVWEHYEAYRGDQPRRDDFELITFMV